jgi:regulator of protease activity HflC (stomatin/prohibitin superfamily)
MSSNAPVTTSITEAYSEDRYTQGTGKQHEIIREEPHSVKPMQLQPLYASEMPLEESDHGIYESCLNCWGAIFGLCGAIPCCCCCQNPYKTVRQGQVGLVQKFGKYYKSVDPGLYSINIFSEKISAVSIKLQIIDMPRQAITTKDNVGVSIDSVVYWHIVDPYTASFLVSNIQQALIERTQATLRQVLGMKTLQEIIENRESIGHQIEGLIAGPASSWGISIESILIKDMIFEKELQETLSAAAKSKRLGESKVIAAQAFVDAARLMREASDILNTPAAMQIRYLETLTSMARDSEQKVIFMPAVTNAGFGEGVNIEAKRIVDEVGNEIPYN